MMREGAVHDIDPAEEWRRVLSSDYLVGRGEFDEEELESLAEVPADQLHVTLGGKAFTAAGLMLADGPAQVQRQVLLPLRDMYIRATDPTSTVFAAMGALDMGGVLASAGLIDEQDAADLLEFILGETAALTDEDLTRLALAAAALRVSNYVPEFVGGSIDGPFVPGEEFGPDFQEFARYLVKAARAEARAEDVAPAWTSFVEYFPLRLQAGSVSWLDLLWGGYGMYTRVAGHRPGEVAQAIHEFVHEVARG